MCAFAVSYLTLPRLSLLGYEIQGPTPKARPNARCQRSRAQCQMPLCKSICAPCVRGSLRGSLRGPLSRSYVGRFAWTAFSQCGVPMREAVNGSNTHRDAHTNNEASEHTKRTRSKTQTNTQTNECTQVNAQTSARARKQVEVRDSLRFGSELRFAVCTSPQGQAAASHRRRR